MAPMYSINFLNNPHVGRDARERGCKLEGQQPRRSLSPPTSHHEPFKPHAKIPKILTHPPLVVAAMSA